MTTMFGKFRNLATPLEQFSKLRDFEDLVWSPTLHLKPWTPQKPVTQPSDKVHAWGGEYRPLLCETIVWAQLSSMLFGDIIVPIIE